MKHFRAVCFVAAPAALLLACGAIGDPRATSFGNGGAMVSTSSGNGASSSNASGSGGAPVACPPCLQDSNCAAGSQCGQFGGDEYCAPSCAHAACASGRTCTAVAGADGSKLQLCVPNTNVCGGRGTGASGSAASSASSSGASSSSGGSCSHSPCVSGAALVSSCEACVSTVCAGDPYCCDTSWNAQCVGEAASSCACSSSSSGGSSSGASSSSSASSSSGAVGTVGPTGGTLSSLSFAIIGDTRPPTEDDTAGYPTAVITKIYQDVEAASPRPAFAISTGDYQFAGPTHTPGTQATQIGYYMSARAAFSNVMFPTMGNHECDGATADNCYACGSACSFVGGTCIAGVCETPNYTTWASNMLKPIGQSLPYYTIDINGTGNAWTAKFVFIACNAWSTTQATWLGTQLAKPTTYTFVVRHEGTDATSAPCLSGTGSANADTIIGQYPHTLLIAGHTHTFEYFASEKQLIVGNGGAPLASSVDYGYVIARQTGSSITFTEYDYATNAVNQTFSVQ